MKFSVCASSVFRDQPLREALPKLRAAGALAYEFWLWWEEEAAPLKALQEELGLRLISVCARFEPMNQPQRQAAFLEGLKETVAYAQALDCPVIIGQTGALLPGVARAEQEKRILDTLNKAARVLEGSGCVLAVEPLNTQIDHKGYFLDRAQDAFRLARAVDSPQIRVLYDIYHQHITEGAPIHDLLDNLDLIAHVHLAGHPGRHEPWLPNEIDTNGLLRAIDAAGYTGYIGLEYFPREAGQALEELAGFLQKSQ